MLHIDGHSADGNVLPFNRLFDAPTSRSWTKSMIRDEKIHGIHSYPGKFPGLIVREAIRHAIGRGVEVKTIADVFCGSGTVACEASRAELAFWGCDVNPVATLITRTKGSQVDATQFRKAAAAIIERFPTSSTTSPVSASATNRLSPWYDEDRLEDLAKLRNAILDEVGSTGQVAEAFACAFSAIVKPLSRWAPRSRRPSLGAHRSKVSVGDAFRRRCRLMADAWDETSGRPASSSTVVCGDVLKLDSPAPPIDLIVTSPPYGTSYEYADFHQLSSLWLGFNDDHRTLRREMIGTRSRRTPMRDALRRLNPVGLQVVFSLFDRDRSLAETIATYFIDMQAVVTRCATFLRPGGMAVFVVGNSQLAGVRIDNANHLVESMHDAGFQDLRVVRRLTANKFNTSYRRPDGRLSAVAGELRIYAEEFVVMAVRG